MIDHSKFAGHTQGPWFVGFNCIESYEGSDICYSVIHAGLERSSDKPNAQLIAAAPELLAENAALREQVERMRSALAICIRQMEHEIYNGDVDLEFMSAVGRAKACLQP